MFRSFAMILLLCRAYAAVLLGVDVWEQEKDTWHGKKVGLIINHTSVNSKFQSTQSRFQGIDVRAIFTPEHGLTGSAYAGDKVASDLNQPIPIYSLYGDSRRPTPAMLHQIDILVYDIQDIGVRAYTYPTTLFYMMEEAAKAGIEVVVFDRPNPINGVTVDGPMLEEKWRSFVGYLNVPYCHGMTIGELAQLFNAEYHVGCKLRVIPMQGWKRSMSYADTGLAWIPPSPNVPEPDTPLYCPMTGLLGELQLANIGIGFTLPFKVVGAPWIDAAAFAAKLNAQKLPGIYFQPFYYRPFWGLYRGKDCQGVLLQVIDAAAYRPLAVQYLLIGLLKSLYPNQFQKMARGPKEQFCKANGTEAIWTILMEEKYPAWKLIAFQQEERKRFLQKRQHYLLY